MPLDWCSHDVFALPPTRAGGATSQDQCFRKFWNHLEQAVGLNLEFGCLWQETSQNLFLKRIGWTTGLVSLFLFFWLSPQKNISLAKCWGQAYEDERSIPDGHLKKDCNVCSIICLGSLILFLFAWGPTRWHRRETAVQGWSGEASYDHNETCA